MSATRIAVTAVGSTTRVTVGLCPTPAVRPLIGLEDPRATPPVALKVRIVELPRLGRRKRIEPGRIGTGDSRAPTAAGIAAKAAREVVELVRTAWETGQSIAAEGRARWEARVPRRAVSPPATGAFRVPVRVAADPVAVVDPAVAVVANDRLKGDRKPW